MLEFVKQFAVEQEKRSHEGDEQRKIHNPLVFLFVGDKSLEALRCIHELVDANWNNASGILYFHIGALESSSVPNTYYYQMAGSCEDRKVLRTSLHQHLYQDEQKLFELNHLIRQMSYRISELGGQYDSFQRLNIAVVTHVTDPCNVVLPEITLLMKSILSESFKFIQVDLYGLVQEKHEGEQFALPISYGISFLKELDRYQAKDYKFHAMLQVTEDQIKFPVEHPSSPLFDLVYLLSDKNEAGIVPENSMMVNYEMICRLNLLKNGRIIEGVDHRYDTYNNTQFKQNIGSASGGDSVYASAGFAKLKRPSSAIAATVVQQFFGKVIKQMKEHGDIQKREMAQLLLLDPPSIERKVHALVPDIGKLEEMNSLMYRMLSVDDLGHDTLRQAEEALYGKTCQDFFSSYFKEPAAIALTVMNPYAELEQTIDHNVIQHPRYGLYCAHMWTMDDSVMMNELRTMIKDTARDLEQARDELADTYQETVGGQVFPRMPLFKKGNTKRFIRHFFNKIYGTQHLVLQLEVKLKLLEAYELALEKLHDMYNGQISQLDEIGRCLKEVSRQRISEASDHLGRNIPEYYETVVDQIAKDLEQKYGPQFYFEDRFMGNIAEQLDGQSDRLLERLIDVCKREVFPSPRLQLSFEDELLARANVAVSFDHREVLSKEMLFRDLYVTLEQDSMVHMDVYNYTHKHRHEEKYFLGDSHSEFIQYAFAADSGSRRYKLGCVHENKSSGLEKLNLMGGFHITDMMFYRNGHKYYETYQDNGYKFHPEEEESIKKV